MLIIIVTQREERGRGAKDEGTPASKGRQR